MTKSQETKYERVGGNLPPLFLLEEGGTLEGIIREAAVVIDKDKKGKETGKRMFYRIELVEDAKGLDSEKNDITYQAGDVISFPGAGGLDYSMRLLAAKIAGIEVDDFEDKDFASLTGIQVKITRRDDEEMKKGKWKGKMAKAFDVFRAVSA